MARIIITGSADGLGALAAKELTARGHHVYLHARSEARAKDAMKSCPEAQKCLIADLSSVAQVKRLAQDIKDLGQVDCIIHNAGVMSGVAGKTTPEGHGLLFATNTLAPYLITSLVGGNSKRYVFLASQMHHGGDATLRNLRTCGYSDSKLHNIMLAFAFSKAGKQRGIEESNALDPGWVPTKMGGAAAPDDITQSIATYVKLAEGAGSSGAYWGPGAKTGHRFQKQAQNSEAQARLANELANASGIDIDGKVV